MKHARGLGITMHVRTCFVDYKRSGVVDHALSDVRVQIQCHHHRNILPHPVTNALQHQALGVIVSLCDHCPM